MSYQDAITFIYSCNDTDQIRALNQALRTQMKQVTSIAKYQFKPGDVVSFDAGRRGKIQGIVVRHMTKNVRVKANNGMMWKVNPILLKKDF